ncbi:hypothetical protein VKT23_001582 [Stygiomarasmius scandens]|uniref:Uncharacterized protein n=1 Tax=Marasmiellus scandens TaxID=2682957 RepID=A0ABR1K0N6_9AGAR
MASRESSTKRKPDSSDRRAQHSSTPTRGDSTSRRNPTPTSNTNRRNPSPPKPNSKSSSSPANGGISRDNSRGVRPSNSTRQHSSSTRDPPRDDRDGNRRPPVQTPTRRPSDPQRRPSTRRPETPGKASPAFVAPKNSGEHPRIRLTDNPVRLERKDTGGRSRSRERDLSRHNSRRSERRDVSRHNSGKSSRDLERNGSGNSSRRDVQRSHSTSKPQNYTSRQGSPPKPSTSSKPPPSAYYKPFTPFQPLDQQAPRVRYDNEANGRPVDEHGQFMDRDKLTPMTTGSTAGWVMVPDNGSIMVCSRCKEPVNPFRPKKSHKNCR